MAEKRKCVQQGCKRILSRWMKQWDVNILQNCITQWQHYVRVRRDLVIHSDKRPLSRLFGRLTRLPVLVFRLRCVFTANELLRRRPTQRPTLGGQFSTWILCIQTIDFFWQSKTCRFKGGSSYLGISWCLTLNMVITYKWKWNIPSIHPSIRHCWRHWVSSGCCRLSELSGESGVHP